MGEKEMRIVICSLIMIILKKYQIEIPEPIVYPLLTGFLAALIQDIKELYR